MLYPYDPNPVAAMIFVVLFGVTTIWHAQIMWRRRSWYFIPLIIGGLLEIVGYVCRFMAHDNMNSILLFILQTLTILVAPALFAASIYMVTGRLIILLNAQSYSIIRPTLLTKIFVGGDIISFIVQIIGSGSISNNFNLAKTIILVGLVVQIIFFGLFVVVTTLFHRRLTIAPTPMSIRLDEYSGRFGWRSITRVVYIASAMIFVRSVFRLIEFTGDHDSVFITSEAFLYVCDSTLMIIVLAILIVIHPSNYIPGREQLRHIQGDELI
ncbi:RTA1 like protein [Thozetella sp. PMI_491]|nr:RTA1 like protein [Thozetella sp. PMI_491]